MEPTILTPQQIKFLQLMGAHKEFPKLFYLTGRTALAAYYLRHRYSEDLDFFSEEEVEPVKQANYCSVMIDVLRHNRYPCLEAIGCSVIIGIPDVYGLLGLECEFVETHGTDMGLRPRKDKRTISH